MHVSQPLQTFLLVCCTFTKMAVVFSRVVAPMAFLWLILPLAHADQTTKITTDLNPGTWEGWGVSLAWWANIFGDRDDLADIFFTKKSTYWPAGKETLPGLGLNIVRYNAGACSSSTVNGSTISLSAKIPAAKQIAGYWLDGASADPHSSSWDWTVDANQRAMMLKAKSRGTNIFELFSNSPMWWQLSNHNPSGSDTGGDNLPASQYENHAIYLSTIAKHAKEHWGVTFDSIEPFNEPAASWWKSTGTQEGCHFDASSQKALIPILYREMQRQGLHRTIISASDENSFQAALNSWDTITEDIEKKYVGRMNVHGYQGSSGPRYGLQQAARNIGQGVWDSEYGDKDASGDTLLQNLMRDLQLLQPTAWVHWQAIDGSGWGLIKGDINNKTLTNATHKYFELAHLTRHILPGMQIVNTTSSNVVSAINERTETLAVIAGNWNVTQSFTFDLSALSRVPADGTKVRSWITDRAGDKLYVRGSDVTISDKSFSTVFEAGTVMTFEVDGVCI